MRAAALSTLLVLLVCCSSRQPIAVRPAAPAELTPTAAPLLEEGASLEAAVLVPASTERAGIAWENEWIFNHYGRFRKKSVALATRNGRRYDVITVETADHTSRILCFDITDFFGK